MEFKYPLPPFTMETALQKVQIMEEIWNSNDPEKLSEFCSINTEWREKTEFIQGRTAVKELLKQKWSRELNYSQKKELWGFRGNRMAVRFEYAYQNEEGQWFKAYGNELLEYDESGLLARRYASMNELPDEEA
ncbi:hypothetical protein SAMN04515674_105209 [Pseudarcicella hirudinis]|uniref:SnoaL-like domain-containing protein n=1 Tax=Pseudarcicella hirudinis TaxID=1079859 RepID=A0A1I5STX0_9BACT|nr:DUF1348 family protein [Pseudarcicella hirudinis]SFP74210.1 hypothetical protein SAMN04515674_105209 [Pseudarcicella hirudinis]